MQLKFVHEAQIFRFDKRAEQFSFIFFFIIDNFIIMFCQVTALHIRRTTREHVNNLLQRYKYLMIGVVVSIIHIMHSTHREMNT